MNNAAQHVANLISPLASAVVLGKTTVENAAAKLESAGVPDALLFLCMGIAAIDATYFGTEYAF